MNDGKIVKVAVCVSKSLKRGCVPLQQLNLDWDHVHMEVRAFHKQRRGSESHSGS
jgi:hypothetical protein